jgi:hypothetical protein
MTQGEPIPLVREWESGGEHHFAIHPLYLALMEHYGLDGFDELSKGGRLLQEMVRGERRAPDTMLERMLALDLEQSDAGYPNDEQLHRIAQLLRRQPQS